mmetsp:Transcript_22292/g.51006  ORF Transcript_22292/g.51006 Transcript_22292/m.51006 type:complete len:713 (+) Transcript_22292:95-2233(+)
MRAAQDMDPGPVRFRTEDMSHRSAPSRANIIYPQEPEGRITNAAMMRAIYNEARAGVGAGVKGWDKVRVLFKAAKSVVARKRVLESIWVSRKESEEESVRRQNAWIKGILRQMSDESDEEEENRRGSRTKTGGGAASTQAAVRSSTRDFNSRTTLAHGPTLRVQRRASLTREFGHRDPHGLVRHDRRSVRSDSDSSGGFSSDSDDGHGRSFNAKHSRSEGRLRRKSNTVAFSSSGSRPASPRMMRALPASFGVHHDSHLQAAPKRRSSVRGGLRPWTPEEHADQMRASVEWPPVLAVGTPCTCASRPSTCEGRPPTGGGGIRRLVPARRESSPLAAGLDTLDDFGAADTASARTESEPVWLLQQDLSRNPTPLSKMQRRLAAPSPAAPDRFKDGRCSVVSNASGLSLDVRDEKLRSAGNDANDRGSPTRSSIADRCRKRPPHSRLESRGIGDLGGSRVPDDGKASNYMKTCFALGGQGSRSAPGFGVERSEKERSAAPSSASYLSLLRRWPGTKGLRAQPLSQQAATPTGNPWQGCFDDLHLEEPSLTFSHDGSPMAGGMLGGAVFVSQQWSTSSRGDTARSKDPLRRDMYSRGSDSSDWGAFNSRSGFASSRFSSGSTRCGTGLPSNRGPGSHITSASRVATPSIKQGAGPLLPPLTAGEMLSFSKQISKGKGQSSLSENFALMDLSRGKQCRLVDLGTDLMSPHWMATGT